MAITSDRGQVLIESLLLLIFLIGFFALVTTEAERHLEKMEKTRFSQKRRM